MSQRRVQGRHGGLGGIPLADELGMLLWAVAASLVGLCCFFVCLFQHEENCKAMQIS